MKSLLFILHVSVIGLFSISCNRFEANHEQIPTEDQPDLKDKTHVANDTTVSISTDTVAR